MQTVSYLFLRFMIGLTSVLPFRMLYIFSDLLYYILFYMVGYRRKVVFTNLKTSFPGKSEAEINMLVKKFYHHLCDITLESIKGFSMSADEVVRRHRIINPETVEKYFEPGKSVICLPAHYNNWEWGSLSPGLQLSYPIVGFYKPLSNKITDEYVKKHRAKFNTRLASIRQTAATFQELAQTPVLYIMAADQSPSNIRDCYWVDFLNHDTACLHGPEKYARKFDIPVLYVEVGKVKRGFYELNSTIITENPSELHEGEITRLYMKYLETTILKEPAYWLWSHKRWKHSRN